MPGSGGWRVFGGLLVLACESLVGAEFDGYRKFPVDSGAAGGQAGNGGIASGGETSTSGTGGIAGASSGGVGGVADASLDVVDSAPEAPDCIALTTPYPAGPYGGNVDDTFPPLEWQGFVNESGVGLATNQPWVDYSMDLVRKSCKKYALIHTSEFT
jgi:hypothetical protein